MPPKEESVAMEAMWGVPSARQSLFKRKQRDSIVLGTGLKIRAIGAVFNALLLRFMRWSSVTATNMSFVIRTCLDCDAL